MTFKPGTRVKVSFADGKAKHGVFIKTPKYSNAQNATALVTFDGNNSPSYVHLTDVKKI